MELEQSFDELNNYVATKIWDDIKRVVLALMHDKLTPVSQADTQFGMVTALCIDTDDPRKQNGVRFFSPFLNDPDTDVKGLPFAYPISSMGGFDDSGLSWVPPAGSTLCLVFENGNVLAPFYIGTTWHRDRGPKGNRNFGYPMAEFNTIHEGHREGYQVGLNDGSQVFPPWNTESYNGIDIDSPKDFVDEPDSHKKTTYPNIYGFKTPQKHMMKMVDGDYKCNHKNKRIEILSSCGNWMVFKDDHLHEIRMGGTDQSPCTDTVDCTPKVTTPSNVPYIKQTTETIPWTGRKTPQNNKCELKQSGIQFLSLSGHSFCMDDSVTQPSGSPEWEKAMKPFNFGCEDKFKGRTFWVSATGHKIEMNDEESDTNVRSKNNYIKIISACGNKIELNDHGIDKKTSGDDRGITLESTSKHVLELRDGSGLEEASQRKEGGIPVSKAKKAYIRMKSGYGLELKMADDNSQEKTQAQYIQLFCPQKDNKERGPHFFRMSEAPSGPGQIFLRSGGNIVCSSYDSYWTVVGDPDKNPSDHITQVTRNNWEVTKEDYINTAAVHVFQADRVILIGAGQDCPIPHSDKLGPCYAPVLVLNNKGQIVASDRVFASASPNAAPLSIFQLLPFDES